MSLTVPSKTSTILRYSPLPEAFLAYICFPATLGTLRHHSSFSQPQEHYAVSFLLNHPQAPYDVTHCSIHPRYLMLFLHPPP